VFDDGSLHRPTRPDCDRCHAAQASRAGALEAATDHAAKAIAARHGDGEVSGEIQAHMIAATG
jgi:hypothetical protein